MDENSLVDVTLGNTLRIWWAFMWRTTIFSILLAAVLGFILGFVLALFGKTEHAKVLGGALGYLVSIPISILVLKQILKKKYKYFSIALISKTNITFESKKT